MSMTHAGGCLCGEVRFAFEGASLMDGQCFCRTCQKIYGGAGNMFMAVAAEGFAFTQGEPRSFRASAGAPARHFCGTCGVHLTARSPKAPAAVLIKVGTLDDPGLFGGPRLLAWTAERQPFHLLAEGVRQIERLSDG